MQFKAQSKHKIFYCVGVNYKKADENVRGLFALGEADKLSLLRQAADMGFTDILVLSTCNRTEIYGFAEHPFQLIKLICDCSKGSIETFEEVGYVYKNGIAVDYLFQVGSGLESQILGDFEIISQIKNSFKNSKSNGLASPFLERLVNAVVQASKRVKTETELSSGATSVAFAAVQYILKNTDAPSEKNILLFGAGKIGRNACENLVKHTKNKQITLINRTTEKAKTLAGKFQLKSMSYADLPSELKNTDILFVATGSETPTITKKLLEPVTKPILILDLSMPSNVEACVAEMPYITVVSLDHLSRVADETLERRKQQIPEAKNIIEEVKADFLKWFEARRFAPVIQALKEKLVDIKKDEIDFQSRRIENFQQQQAEIIADRFIQKITTQFANHLKTDNDFVDESVELIQKVFKLQIQSYE